MDYTFELRINTDGDFGFSYGPIGMIYNAEYQTYDFFRSYKEKNLAINDIIGIIDILKNSIHTSRDYVKNAWLEHCDNFIEKIVSMESEYICEEMGGNHEGTKLLFVRERPLCLSVDIYLTDEEYEMIKNRTDIDYYDIKDAILKLYKEEK